MVPARATLLRAMLLTGLVSTAGPAAGDGPVEGSAAIDAAVPMELILERARADFDGRILEVELEKEGRGSAGYVYEVKLLTENGRVVKVEYDAHTLERVRVRGARRDNND